MYMKPITVFVCEICGAEYCEQINASTCEKQGVEDLKFGVGDFCFLEKEVDSGILKLGTRPDVVMAQVVAIKMPCILNPQPPRQWSGGKHTHELYLRFDNFDQPLPDSVKGLEFYNQGRLLPLNLPERSKLNVAELRRALRELYGYAYSVGYFLKKA